MWNCNIAYSLCLRKSFRHIKPVRELCAVTAFRANGYSVSRGLYVISLLHYCTATPHAPLHPLMMRAACHFSMV